MSKKNHFCALQEIRNWNVDDVVDVLLKNGLGDCVESFRKRGVDGEALLDLTEVKLALWKREIKLVNIRKLSAFIQDLNQDPVKYQLSNQINTSQLVLGISKDAAKCKPDTNRDITVSRQNNKVASDSSVCPSPIVKTEIGNPVSLKGLLPVRSNSSSSFSDASSWDTDYDDDLEDKNPKEVEDDGTNTNDKPFSISDSVSWSSGPPRGSGEVGTEVKTPALDVAEKGITGSCANTNNSQPVTQAKPAIQPPVKLNIPNAFPSKPEIISAKPIVKQSSQMNVATIHPPSVKLKSEIQEKSVKTNGVTSTSNVHPSQRPPVPLRPPVLHSKPAKPPDISSLPKPPGMQQGHGNVKELISNLNLNCDEEYYEGLYEESYTEMNDVRERPLQTVPPSHIPPISSIELNPTTLSSCSEQPYPPFEGSPIITKGNMEHIITHVSPPLTTSYEHCHPESHLQGEYDVCEQDDPQSLEAKGYESEEYESIQDHMTTIPATGDGSEYYLQPIQPQSVLLASATTLCPEPLSEAPPLPEKPRSILPDIIAPTVKSAQSRPKTDDTGSSADGVTGKLGGLFWNRLINRPGNTNTVDRTIKGPLLYNLVNRLGTEMADGAVGMKQRILYPIRRLLSRYDDVLPPEGEESEGGTAVRRATSFNIATRKERSLSATCIHYSPSAPTPGPRVFTKKTPTPEPKKTTTLPLPGHKPPPPVEQRAVSTSSTQGRPLPQPPTCDTNQISCEKNITNGRRKSGTKPVTQMPWYHKVDRRRGEELLKNGEDGCFLVRPSTQTSNPWTLTLKYNGRLYNISVRQRPDGLYALGTEKANEQSFASIEELITNYQSEKLVLYTGGERAGTTLLTTSPRRETSHQ